jgi:hypothetical protein
MVAGAIRLLMTLLEVAAEHDPVTCERLLYQVSVVLDNVSKSLGSIVESTGSLGPWNHLSALLTSVCVAPGRSPRSRHLALHCLTQLALLRNSAVDILRATQVILLHLDDPRERSFKVCAHGNE